MAPCAISYSEILAWQGIYSVTLTPMEIDLIFIMDHAAISTYSEKK